MQATQSAVITAKVNEVKFLEHLKTMFSTTSSFIAEAMQNAYRAGSLSLSFVYSKENNTLEISDSGRGIEDFQNLVSIAESGWDQSIIERDAPFGMGFAAVVFAAKEGLEVASRGKEVFFSAENLIHQKAIEVRPSEFIGGTRVRLRGLLLEADKAREEARSYARGFPIPVSWNGEVFERSFAQDQLIGEMTEVGFVHITELSEAKGKEKLEYKKGFRGYLQGLPCISSRTYSEVGAVVHLNRSFTPRMPDRNSLIDEKAAIERIEAAIKEVWVRHLQWMKRNMDPLSFAEKYWDVAWSLGCFEALMFDVPWIPKCALFEIDGSPYLDRCSSYFDWMSRVKAPISRQDIESGRVVLCSDDFDLEGPHGFFPLLWAQKMNGVFLSVKLPEGHWAASKVLSMTWLDIKIDCGKVYAEESFYGRWVGGGIQLVEKIAVTIRGKEVLLSEPVASKRNYDSMESSFFIPKSAVEGSSAVLLQASSYVDSDSHEYQRTDHDLDCEEFEAIVAVMNGESADKTIARLLGSAHLYSNLKWAKFAVSFDDKGRPEVLAL